ncbi:MAG TPA: glycosyltransferase family A protein [Draconibacterium sp.]|nr:glycosyltransferase family A protein [Draconibacterium sp.]
MDYKINCFIAYNNEAGFLQTINQLRASELVNNIFVLSPVLIETEKTEILVVTEVFSTATIKLIAEYSNTSYSLIILHNQAISIGQFALERMLQVAENTGAAMVYADYFEIKNGIQTPHPVIDYQLGSLRDDFNFGPVQLFRNDVLKTFVEKEFNWAGYYSLRLHASRLGELVRIPEFLFTMNETDTRKSGEKQFDYVSGNAREKQIEMEKVCTSHLQKIGGFLQPQFKEIDLSKGEFPVEASVIIPVRNRIKTIKDAMESVLSQKTDFSFNLIVVDNFSTDGTTELLAEYAKNNKLIHIIPDRNDLGIGGCWNVGIFSEMCGKFAVQLDSDDLYSSENTLQKIVDKFYE